MTADSSPHARPPEAALPESAPRAGAENNRDALRASDQRFSTFIRRSLDGIVIIDSHGTILEWNEGQEEITGIPTVVAGAARVVGCQPYEEFAAAAEAVGARRRPARA